LFLLSHCCLQVCESSPTLRAAALSLCSRDARQSFRTVEAEAGLNRPLRDSELAALQLLSSLTTLCAALTLIPLAVVCSYVMNRVQTWRTCCLWSTLPCLAVFLPKSDLLFPLTSTAIIAFIVLAVQTRFQMLFALLAGVTLWFGLLFSLAHLPVVVLLVILAGLRVVQTRGASLRTDMRVLFAMLLSVAVLTILWNGATNCNLLTVWKLNLQNHERFYGSYQRTWWKWLPVNLIELAMSVGPALFVVVMAGTATAVRAVMQTGTDNRVCDMKHSTLAVATLATLTLLWLSGKNQGEAARLWCFLTPWLLIVAGTQWNSGSDKDSTWTATLLLQIVFGAAVVSRVSGFSF
jgi:hypothetical protein